MSELAELKKINKKLKVLIEILDGDPKRIVGVDKA